jgi:signal peptidase I
MTKRFALLALLAFTSIARAEPPDLTSFLPGDALAVFGYVRDPSLDFAKAFAAAAPPGYVPQCVVDGVAHIDRAVVAVSSGHVTFAARGHGLRAAFDICFETLAGEKPAVDGAVTRYGFVTLAWIDDDTLAGGPMTDAAATTALARPRPLDPSSATARLLALADTTAIVWGAAASSGHLVHALVSVRSLTEAKLTLELRSKDDATWAASAFGVQAKQVGAGLRVDGTKLIVDGKGAAMFLRAALIEGFKVPAGSMMPTILVGDHVYIDKLDYLFAPPTSGDLVVFTDPGTRKDFVKRVVAVGGDVVSIKDGVLSVNGQSHARKDLGERRPWDYDESADRWVQVRGEAFEEDGHETLSVGVSRDWPSADASGPPDAVDADWRMGRYVVPNGSVFVLGDNRDNSHDSRWLGSIPVAYVKGRVFMIWWSTGQPEGIRWDRIATFF